MQEALSTSGELVDEVARSVVSVELALTGTLKGSMQRQDLADLSYQSVASDAQLPQLP